MCSSAVQCVTVNCSVLQCIAVCCSVLQCVAVCCSVLQCVAAVCCSVSQCSVEGLLCADRVRCNDISRHPGFDSIRVCVHIYIYINIYKYKYVNINIYTCIHIHINVFIFMMIIMCSTIFIEPADSFKEIENMFSKNPDHFCLDMSV